MFTGDILSTMIDQIIMNLTSDREAPTTESGADWAADKSASEMMEQEHRASETREEYSRRDEEGSRTRRST